MNSYLLRLGYRVDACRSAADAWALLQADPSLYAGALVDLNMPGMGGEELALRILDCECVDPAGGDERLSGGVERSRDAGRQPGPLSCTSHSLRKIWPRRSNRTGLRRARVITCSALRVQARQPAGQIAG